MRDQRLIKKRNLSFLIIKNQYTFILMKCSLMQDMQDIFMTLLCTINIYIADIYTLQSDSP